MNNSPTCAIAFDMQEMVRSKLVLCFFTGVSVGVFLPRSLRCSARCNCLFFVRSV